MHNTASVILRTSSGTSASNTLYGLGSALLLSALASIGQASASVVEEVGYKVRHGLDSTYTLSSLDATASVGQIVAALQDLASTLAAAQTDLSPEDKNVLYSNLWELYD